MRRGVFDVALYVIVRKLEDWMSGESWLQRINWVAKLRYSDGRETKLHFSGYPDKPFFFDALANVQRHIRGESCEIISLTRKDDDSNVPLHAPTESAKRGKEVA